MTRSVRDFMIEYQVNHDDDPDDQAWMLVYEALVDHMDQEERDDEWE